MSRFPSSLATRRTALVCLAAGLLAAGCSSFKLTNVWRSPEFRGPPVSSALVLGVSRSDVHRRIFEDGFSQALKAAGTTAQASYPLLPDSGQIADDKIKATVARSGAHAVLITRLLKVDQQVSVTPAMAPMHYGRGFYGWYGSAWAALPPSVDVYNVLTIETTLWDASTAKVIWSGTTETTDASDVNKATQALAQVLIERMKKDGVI
jgi:hypothetical protein